MTGRVIFRISLGLLLYLILPGTSAEEQLNVKDAWVNEAPPGVSILAAYATLENKSTVDISLVKVESPDFESIELHESIIENGIAKMKKRDSVQIRGNTQLEFLPGGLHFMLIKPCRKIQQGDNVSLNFYFSNNSTINIQAPVKKAGGEMHEHQHNH